MGLFAGLFGTSQTKKPKDLGCWEYSPGRVVIQWGRAPELHTPCGAIRLEGRGLSERMLVIYGIDGQFHAFRNKCPIWGTRLDPVPGTAAVCCNGWARSTFDYTGNIMSGPGKATLKTYKVEVNKCKVIITVD